MPPLIMSSASRIDQQLSCASKSLSPEIPLAAWGGILNSLLRSSNMTTETLLQSWLRARSMSPEQVSPHLLRPHVTSSLYRDQANTDQDRSKRTQVQETDTRNLYLTYVAATTIMASQDEPSKRCNGLSAVSLLHFGEILIVVRRYWYSY